jgi:hypothetical protein
VSSYRQLQISHQQEQAKSFQPAKSCQGEEARREDAAEDQSRAQRRKNAIDARVLAVLEKRFVSSLRRPKFRRNALLKSHC